jgi:hypothetical protein
LVLFIIPDESVPNLSSPSTKTEHPYETDEAENEERPAETDDKNYHGVVLDDDEAPDLPFHGML